MIYISKEKSRERAIRIIEKRKYDIMTFAPSYTIHTNDNMSSMLAQNVKVPLTDPKYCMAFKRVLRNNYMDNEQFLNDSNFPKEEWRYIPSTTYQISSYGRVKKPTGRITTMRASRADFSNRNTVRIEPEHSPNGRSQDVNIFAVMYEVFPELFYHWIPFTHYGEEWTDITDIHYEAYKADYGEDRSLRKSVRIYFSSRGRFARVRVRDSEIVSNNRLATLPMFNRNGTATGGDPYTPIGGRNEYVDLNPITLLKEIYPDSYAMMIRRKFLDFETYDGELWLPIPGQNDVFWSSNRIRTLSLTGLIKARDIGSIHELAEGSRLTFPNKRRKHLPFARRLFGEAGAAERASTIIDIGEKILRGEVSIGNVDLSSEAMKRTSSSFVVYDEYSGEKEYFKSAIAITEKYGIPNEQIKLMLRREIGSFNGYSVYYSGEVERKIGGM